MKSTMTGHDLLPVVIVLCATLTETLSVDLKRIVVPSPVLAGEDVKMSCITGLPTSQLYSLKWFKDEEEFYRYLPKEEPMVKAYDTAGVSVNLDRSFQGTVYLNSVSMDSVGTFKCEVSGESPMFRTEAVEKQMEVYILPTERPWISGEEDSYRINELAELNCTSGYSFPAVRLTWYINSVRIPGHYVKNYEEVTNVQGLIQTNSELSFVISKSHFNEDGIMKITCHAVIGQRYNDTVVENIAHDIFQSRESELRSHTSKDNHGALKTYRNSGNNNAFDGCCRNSVCLLALFVSVLFLNQSCLST